VFGNIKKNEAMNNTIIGVSAETIFSFDERASLFGLGGAAAGFIFLCCLVCTPICAILCCLAILRAKLEEHGIVLDGANGTSENENEKRRLEEREKEQREIGRLDDIRAYDCEKQSRDRYQAEESARNANAEAFIMANGMRY
jgi:hypothetical protein